MMFVILFASTMCFCSHATGLDTTSSPYEVGISRAKGNRTTRSYSNAVDIYLANGKELVSVNVSLLGSVLHLKYMVNSSEERSEVTKPTSLGDTTAEPLVTTSNAVHGRAANDSELQATAERLQMCSSDCRTMDGMTGYCYSKRECYRRGGKVLGSCCGKKLCCVFEYSCGDISGEEIAYFRSPGYPARSTGSIACDFDLLIRTDVCAVRIDFFNMYMVGRLGGVCDVDQILVINAADGPTTSHCGNLAGYTTTIAVSPSQTKPLKVIAIMQNVDEHLWDMRLKQIPCSQLSYFKQPYVCGSKAKLEPSYSFYNFLDLWRNIDWYSEGDYMDQVWWNFPSPVFNKYYYGSSQKLIQQSHETAVPKAEDRIIHGSDAEMHEFPWQVAVVLKDTFFCGGALINEEFVLSAAHCFLTRDTPVTELGVYLGDHDLTHSNETFHTVRGVKRIHFHSHFHALLLSNDIAMLQMDRSVAFSDRVRPVCLPYLGESHVGEEATVTGWGITTFPDGKPSSQLQKLNVQVISNQECELAIEEQLGIGNLCAVPNGLQGTCFGDSGGPLIVNNKDKETIIGIISFGVTGCAMLPGFPDLYTRVSEYLKWIDISALTLDR